MGNWDDFDPNEPPQQATWATYVPARRGAAFKVHKTRGPALNAIMQHGRSILYRWEGGRWEEVAKKDVRQNTECDECGKDLPTLYAGRYKFRHEYHRGPVAEPLELVYVCPTCSYHV